MFKRPSNREEGITILQSALQRTSEHKNANAYSVLWHAADYMINGTWEHTMLKRLCECSEITAFLFNTVCPVVEEMLCTPDQWEKNIAIGLEDENAPKYMEEAYTSLQDMRDAAAFALTRQDIDADIRMCATETLKLFDSAHFCECIRCVALTSFTGRLCFRIGFPRMTKTFNEDTALHAERMNIDILKQFVIP